MFGEFRAFLLKTNALALAIGIIIGVALGNVVNSHWSQDIIMPPIGVLLGGVDFGSAGRSSSRTPPVTSPRSTSATARSSTS